MIPSVVMRQIRRIQIRTSRMVNEILAGQYESVFKGQGMEFKEVRSYVPGDDVRAIDWNVTARTGSPHVKVMAEERELTVMLLVDMSGSMRFGSVSRFKNELAAELGAVVAFSAIQNNDKVGLLVFTDKIELFVPPNKGRKHVLRVIREILCFEPGGAGTDIPAALHYMNNVVRRRAVVFLVSDFMAEGCEDALRLAAKRHDLIAVTMSDPREAELPNAGLVALRDPETGREYVADTGNPRLRRAYAERAERRMRARDEMLRRNKIDAMRVINDHERSYIREFHRFFRMREMRKR